MPSTFLFRRHRGGISLDMLLQQHRQRDVLATEFSMHASPVGLEVTPMALLRADDGKQFALELAVGHLGRQWPPQAGGLEALQRVANRRRRDTNATGNLPSGDAAYQPQSKDFAHLAHPRSLRRHLPLLCGCKVRQTHPLRGWPASIGMGGRLPSESVAGLRRNHWPDWIGLRSCKEQGPESASRGTRVRSFRNGGQQSLRMVGAIISEGGGNIIPECWAACSGISAHRGAFRTLIICRWLSQHPSMGRRGSETPARVRTPSPDPRVYFRYPNIRGAGETPAPQGVV